MTEPSDVTKPPRNSALDDRQDLATTNVVGRPPGRYSQPVSLPRGVEVLIKKASVDPEFRALLLDKRAEAAREIDLALSPAEMALLNSVPAAQIERIIAHTTVPDRHRRVFLGKVAGLMLAALGAQLAGCKLHIWTGITPEMEAATQKPAGTESDSPEQGISCNTEDIRRDPDGKRLAYKIFVQGPSSVSLSVAGNLPFENGHVEVSFRGGTTSGDAELIHQSGWLPVQWGKGPNEVRVRGAKGKTDWLVIRFVNRAVKAGKNKDDLLELPKPPYEPGEYVLGECMIYRIAKFVKEWRA